jgi:3-oxoacyl-[acyl-carrier-protein] synthase II
VRRHQPAGQRLAQRERAPACAGATPCVHPEWEIYEGPEHAPGGARAADFELPAHYNRKVTRSMGRVAVMSVLRQPRRRWRTPA